ncbi:MAG: hypothetical protein IH611_05445 [Deltaproteobacteria bacterium]|nr:hypothetical protein [Deltaproteobacteria bacterium]
MKTRLGAVILAGAFLVTSAFTTAAMAGDQDKDQVKLQQKLQDGSCLTDLVEDGAAMESVGLGNTYGIGDGTGPYLPENGTGYGAPANR